MVYLKEGSYWLVMGCAVTPSCCLQVQESMAEYESAAQQASTFFGIAKSSLLVPFLNRYVHMATFN